MQGCLSQALGGGKESDTRNTHAPSVLLDWLDLSLCGLLCAVCAGAMSHALKMLLKGTEEMKGATKAIEKSWKDAAMKEEEAGKELSQHTTTTRNEDRRQLLDRSVTFFLCVVSACVRISHR